MSTWFYLYDFLAFATQPMQPSDIGRYFRSNKVTSCNEGGKCSQAWRRRWQSGTSRQFYAIFILHSCWLLDTPRHLSRRRFYRLNHVCVRDARVTVPQKTDLRSTNSTNDNPCIDCKFAYRVQLLTLAWFRCSVNFGLFRHNTHLAHIYMHTSNTSVIYIIININCI